MARSRREFVLLDVLRFVAALCILVFHFEIFALKGAPLPQRWFGGLDAAVDFFFVLSGFVIAHSAAGRLDTARDYAAFMLRRIARLYPLHIATLGLAIALAFGASLAGIRLGEPARYDLAYLPANLLLTQAWGFHDRLTFNLVSWSISAEWFLYLTFPLTFWIARSLGFGASIAALVVWFLAIRIAEQHFGWQAWNDRTYNFAMIRALPAFFLGAALWVFWNQRLSDRRCSPALVLGLFAAAVVMMALRVPNELLIAAFAVIVVTGAMAEEARPKESEAALARLLGGASYGLYMWHHLLGGLVFAALKPRGAAMIVVALLIATVVSLAASVLSYRWFERPAQRAILVRFAQGQPRR